MASWTGVSPLSPARGHFTPLKGIPAPWGRQTVGDAMLEPMICVGGEQLPLTTLNYSLHSICPLNCVGDTKNKGPFHLDFRRLALGQLGF